MGAILFFMLPACLILPPFALIMLFSALKDVDRERDELMRLTWEEQKRQRDALAKWQAEERMSGPKWD